MARDRAGARARELERSGFALRRVDRQGGPDRRAQCLSDGEMLGRRPWAQHALAEDLEQLRAAPLPSEQLA